jgi:hypothetical protein
VGGPGWAGTPPEVEHTVDLDHAVGAVRTSMGL